jgi:hypothetical protein
MCYDRNGSNTKGTAPGCIINSNSNSNSNRLHNSQQAAQHNQPHNTVVYILVGCGDPSKSHRSSIVDPLNITPRTHLARIPCVVNAKCDTCLPIVVSFDPRATRMRWIPTTNQN